MEMPAAYIMGVNAMAEAYSARPDAPVVPHVEPAPRSRPIRLALSRALHRAGDAVAPAAPCASC
jgi:hypothetical protein